MNTFTQTLGLSAVLLAAITTTAHAKEITVLSQVNGGTMSYTLNCSDSSGSTTEQTKYEQVTQVYGDVKPVQYLKHNYSDCKVIKTTLLVEERKQ